MAFSETKNYFFDNSFALAEFLFENNIKQLCLLRRLLARLNGQAVDSQLQRDGEKAFECELALEEGVRE
jgi:hypothetical protein